MLKFACVVVLLVMAGCSSRHIVCGGEVYPMWRYDVEAGSSVSYECRFCDILAVKLNGAHHDVDGDREWNEYRVLFGIQAQFGSTRLRIGMNGGYVVSERSNEEQARGKVQEIMVSYVPDKRGIAVYYGFRYQDLFDDVDNMAWFADFGWAF